MARFMPPLPQSFALAVNRALELPEAGERVRANSPPHSIGRRELNVRRIEALYETAYLRVFLLWEDFLEQSFLRYLCGYASSLGAVALKRPRYKSLAAAEAAVLSGNTFVSWAKPEKVANRSQRFITAGHHELVLKSNLSRMQAFNSVRNRIAHSSRFARNEFDGATMMLHGRRYPASSPGRFLRDSRAGAPVPESWLRYIAGELKSLAAQICP